MEFIMENVGLAAFAAFLVAMVAGFAFSKSLADREDEMDRETVHENGRKGERQ